MFEKGDVVQVKAEFLEPEEAQESTMGLVLDYNPCNDRISIGVLNPEDWAIPPVFDARGHFYEKIDR